MGLDSPATAKKTDNRTAGAVKEHGRAPEPPRQQTTNIGSRLVRQAVRQEEPSPADAQAETERGPIDDGAAAQTRYDQ
jgi:hypothetical protein